MKRGMSSLLSLLEALSARYGQKLLCQFEHCKLKCHATIASLMADAALLVDSVSLGEGGLQPIGMGDEEGCEQSALTAGGTISKVESAIALSV